MCTASRQCTATIGYVHNLGSPPEHCTLGVQFANKHGTSHFHGDHSVYSYTIACTVRVPWVEYINWEVPRRLVKKLYDSGDAHGISQHVDHCGTNGILVQRLYGCYGSPTTYGYHRLYSQL